MLKCTLTISRFTIPNDSMHTSLTFQTNLRQPSQYRGVLHCEGYDYEQDPVDINNPLSDPFFTRRMKLLNIPGGFMLYGKKGIHFFSTSELLNPKMKIMLRLIRARHIFHMISDNPNCSLGIVGCSLYTRLIALKDDYHKTKN